MAGGVGEVEGGRLEAGRGRRGAGTAPRPSLAQAEAGRLRRGALITRPTVSLPAVAQRGRFAALPRDNNPVTSAEESSVALSPSL